MKFDTLSDFKSSVVAKREHYREAIDSISGRMNDPQLPTTAPAYIKPMDYAFKKAQRIKENTPKATKPTTKKDVIPKPETKITKKQVDRLVSKYKTMVGKEMNKRLSAKLKDEKGLKKILTTLSQSIAYQPNI